MQPRAQPTIAAEEPARYALKYPCVSCRTLVEVVLYFDIQPDANALAEAIVRAQMVPCAHCQQRGAES
jgi:hypothetical protein